MSSVGGEDDSAAKAPQQVLEDFWDRLVTKKPGKVTNIFPQSLYTNLLPPQRKPGSARGRNAAESYQAAADECRARVKRIVRECNRTNEKFCDPDFDIESDRACGANNCLEGLMEWFDDTPSGGSAVNTWQLGEAFRTLAASNLLVAPTMAIDVNAATRIMDSGSGGASMGPGSVHRIDWVFENPSFTVDGFSSSDVQQGKNGDCWFIAAVASICSNPDLMDKVCVEKNEECGVYGFVFYRDGEWTYTVVDDNLYLNSEDIDAFGDDYDPSGKKERKWKKNYQTGSDALYFASCADQNETWLPLLEKAYAKVHGDYESISGGITGEAIEDLTGGVTTKVMTNRILSKERLWKELLQVNKQFLFSASSPGSYGDDTEARRGLALSHAYSIMKTVEEADEDGKKVRLVQVRNPWGRRSYNGMGEWNGAWADGSSEWTPYWMEKLNYRFADDGLFWMSYDDLQKRFRSLDRTRLFDADWTIVSQWTSTPIAWMTGFLTTKFVVEIKKGGPTVFVLCQLDGRYFKGLEGKYRFDLHFIVQEENASPGEHIVRARGAYFGNRSISAEVDLEPGKYEVLPKIVASKDDDQPEVHEVVTKLADRNPQKLRQIGMNYDIANAKGVIEVSEEDKKKREEKRKEAQEKKKKEKEEAEKEKAEFEAWKKERREKEEKEKADKAKASSDKDGTEKTETSNEEVKSADSKLDDPAPAESKKADGAQEAIKESTIGDNKEATSEPKKTASDTEGKDPDAKDKTEAKNDSAEDSDDTPRPTPDSEEEVNGLSPRSAPVVGPSGDMADGEATAPAAAPRASDNKQNPWNAVCVLGLRVYSKDPEVSIKLVKPKDAEEGAVLDADGATQAGATM